MSYCILITINWKYSPCNNIKHPYTDDLASVTLASNFFSNVNQGLSDRFMDTVTRLKWRIHIDKCLDLSSCVAIRCPNCELNGQQHLFYTIGPCSNCLITNWQPFLFPSQKNQCLFDFLLHLFFNHYFFLFHLYFAFHIENKTCYGY